MRQPPFLIGRWVLLALCAAGCTMLGPDYETPSAPVQNDWLEYDDPRVDSVPPIALEWWTTAFNDPILDQLVETALAENLSLRSAGLRVLQSRQQLAIAIGNQYPQQQLVTGQGGTLRENGSSFESYDFAFRLSWEADVWGRFRRQIESASALLDASIAGYDGVMVSLIADVAQNYLLIRITQRRLAVALRNYALQQESVRISQAKFVAGEVSSLDLEQAQTLLYNTQAAVVSLEPSLQQFKNSLAILLGRPPHDMSEMFGALQPIPTVEPEIAVGMPQDLLRRRPDIRIAERQLAAQSAQIGFAITELYPHFGIDGSIGSGVATQGDQDFGDLFSSDTSSYNLFGFFDWNIFNYGRLKNNVRLQDAFFQQLLEDYRQSVLNAQVEIENAIVAFLKSQEQLEAIQLAADAAQRAADISTAQYQDGLVDFNTVITTLTALVNQTDQLATAQGTVTTNLVTVYRSLGGGWEFREGREPLDLIPEETQEEMLERGEYWQKTFEQ